ncbi:MAG: hypothetical protein GXO60_09745 [Epsilonproteobacteria bacterium]|nr:hypothetical protein [Campylobacterota bacterium]
MSIDREVLPKKVDIQIPATPNLKHDYSVMIDENGTQVQTVDNHWKLGNPLPKDIRDKLDRQGVCLSCHQSIPKGDLAISAMNHIANMTGMQIDNDMHKGILNKSIKISAWVQIGLGLIFGFGVLIWWFRRKR